MRILFALPGLHRVERGAEVAFVAIASQLARAGDDVTLLGSGPQRDGAPYRFIKGSAVTREHFERFPSMPLLRGDTAWEELSFLPSLMKRYRPEYYDVTVTCSYPFTNMALRRRGAAGNRPAHVFVTQNGDWPAYSNKAEFRFFDCDGLVCTNPDYFERNSGRYRSALIPNGVDVARFNAGTSQRQKLGLDPNKRIVLMVSAMIASKNVAEGIKAVAAIPQATLVVAGDGPLRDDLRRLADRLMPGRYQTISVSPAEMPALYHSTDVFLHLSRDESFGNVFIEALACGIPIVAHDLVRTRWILGDEAYYVAADSVEAITAQLSAAFDDEAGASERRARSAEKYDWTSVAFRYRQFFTEVIEACK